METSNTKRIFTDSEIVAAIKGMMNAKFDEFTSRAPFVMDVQPKP